MILKYLAFTDTGENLAEMLAKNIGGEVSRSGKPLNMRAWTEQNFNKADGLIFVGAVGIAVRAIAPFVCSKTSDPAVVVVDECANFAVSLLSGHLGGANDLTRKISKICGATAVITTATDLHGVFAADEWAKRQNADIIDSSKIKNVSSKILSGKNVSVYSRWNINGNPPENIYISNNYNQCDISLDIYKNNADALKLVPKIVTIGIGCRKNIPTENVEKCFEKFIEKTGLCEQSICMASSIDLKKDEAGLIKFCSNHGWALNTFSAETLQNADGIFSQSQFVQKITGVDNVCERSAVLASGGKLIERKFICGGVTIAAAEKQYKPDWRWKDE